MSGETKNLADFIVNSIQLVIVVAGVGWAYLRFRKESPLHPRIEFDVDCKFFGEQKNSRLTAVTIVAQNKGSVEHKFSEIRCRIRGIEKDVPLSEFKEYHPLVEFPVEILKDINIVPAKYEYYFVRPNVSQSFNFTLKMPSNIQFVIVRVMFKYQASDEIHTAEKVFEVT